MTINGVRINGQSLQRSAPLGVDPSVVLNVDIKGICLGSWDPGDQVKGYTLTSGVDHLLENKN